MRAPRLSAQLHAPPLSPASPWQAAPLAELRGIWESVPRDKILGSFHQEFLALTEESDPELLRNGLLGLARHLRGAGQDGLADRIDAALGADTQPHFAEAFLSRFAQEAVHPAAIVAMGLAGFAFRATRLGVWSHLLAAPEAGLWTRGWGAKLAAGGAGFLAEASTFTLSQSALNDQNSDPGSDSLPKKFAANAWFLGALKLSGALALGAWSRLEGKLGAAPLRDLLPIAAQAGGLYLARKGEEQLGWRHPRSGGEEAGDLVATLLQFHVAGALQHRLAGPAWRFFEARIAALETADSPPPQAWASAAQSQPTKGPAWGIFPSRLLYAVSEAPGYGSKPHLLTFEALERLFLYNARASATGSLQNALWQSFLHEASVDPSEAQGRRALLSAFAVMEGEPDRNTLLRLAEYYNYARQWRLSATEYAAAAKEIQQLPGRDRFPLGEIEIALETGRTSPYGRIILQRLRDIVAAGDIPGKLRELWKQESFDTATTLERLRRAGLRGEALAAIINNTAHTAYLDDLRVARKVVSVFEEISPYLRNPRLRENNLTKLRQDFMKVWRRYPELGADAMLAFLKRQSDPQATAFLRAIQQGKVELEMVSPNAFDEGARDHGISGNDILSLFLKPRHPKVPSMIWLRTMPETISPEDPEAVFAEFSGRAVALFHEWEHFRHFHGEFEANEVSSRPFDIRHMGREDRLASETMALLEQWRWALKHLDDDYYQVSRQMGENLAQLCRNIADLGYFGTAP